MALVLSTGADVVLMRTRQLLLEREGHSVITVSDDESLASACKRYVFDVAILGHTLPAKMKRHDADLIRRHCPNVKLLELYSGGWSLNDADSWLQVPAETPAELANRVTDLSKRSITQRNLTVERHISQ